MIVLIIVLVAAVIIFWVRNADHRDARHRADLGDDVYREPFGDL